MRYHKKKNKTKEKKKKKNKDQSGANPQRILFVVYYNDKRYQVFNKACTDIEREIVVKAISRYCKDHLI